MKGYLKKSLAIAMGGNDVCSGYGRLRRFRNFFFRQRPL